MKEKKVHIRILIVFLLMAAFKCITVYMNRNPYAEAENWAYLETDVQEKDADTFFICPTVYGGDEYTLNWKSFDEDTKASFIGATNMEKGLYDENTRFFAPYYHQTALYTYTQSEEVMEKSLDEAYKDIRKAFQYYLDHYNKGRPIVLAGFSQGGDMCVRLMKEFFADEKLSEQLVACYAIGWYITDEELADNPHIHCAEGEEDTGVLIMFGSESADAEPTVVHPADKNSYCINPLNWKTDGTKADRTLNKGACFTDYSGAVTSEIPMLTGAYIESKRGALVASDIDPEEYPGLLNIVGYGNYHIYDYMFFYRNLQENVRTRINAYIH